MFGQRFSVANYWKGESLQTIDVVSNYYSGINFYMQIPTTRCSI